MSMYLLVNNEDSLIDSFRPQIDNVSPHVTQSDTVNEHLQSAPSALARQELPDAAVGGRPGSGSLNGYSTGFRGRSATLQPFSGAVIAAPPITNPVQGQVGMNNRQGKQYAGVIDQLTQYVPSQLQYAAAWVGKVPDNAKAVK